MCVLGSMMQTDEIWVLLLRADAVSTSIVAWLSFLNSVSNRWHAGVGLVLVDNLWRASW
jgi:hypothetical protein